MMFIWDITWYNMIQRSHSWLAGKDLWSGAGTLPRWSGGVSAAACGGTGTRGTPEPRQGYSDPQGAALQHPKSGLDSLDWDSCFVWFNLVDGSWVAHMVEDVLKDMKIRWIWMILEYIVIGIEYNHASQPLYEAVRPFRSRNSTSWLLARTPCDWADMAP